MTTEKKTKPTIAAVKPLGLQTRGWGVWKRKRNMYREIAASAFLGGAEGRKFIREITASAWRSQQRLKDEEMEKIVTGSLPPFIGQRYRNGITVCLTPVESTLGVEHRILPTALDRISDAISSMTLLLSQYDTCAH